MKVRIHSKARIVGLAICLSLGIVEVAGQTPVKGGSTFRIPAEAPIQLCVAALRLSEEELSAVGIAVPGDEVPWLIYSDDTGPVGYLPPARPPVTAYLPPETATPAIIRGRQAFLRRMSPQNWFFVGFSEYAQVAPNGKTLEAVDWNQPSNRPFGLTGDFKDEEILDIVMFMRHGTRAVGPISVPVARDKRVSRIERRADGLIEVRVGDIEWAAEFFILKRDGESWVVVRTYFVVA